MTEGSGAVPEPGAGSGSQTGKVPETAPDTGPDTRPDTGADKVPEQRTAPPPATASEKVPEKSELRIGHAERAAALAALDDHFEAGRLDVTEYGDRSAVAGAAVVTSELTALFRDLPAPHPDLPGRPGVTTTPAPGTPEAWDAVATRRDTPPMRHWAEALRIVLPVLLVAAMITLAAVGHPEILGFFPFVFILAHRFGPHRRR